MKIDGGESVPLTEILYRKWSSHVVISFLIGFFFPLKKKVFLTGLFFFLPKNYFYFPQQRKLKFESQFLSFGIYPSALFWLSKARVSF